MTREYKEHGDILTLESEGNIVTVITNGNEVAKLWLCDSDMEDLFESSDMGEVGNIIDEYILESL